MKNMIEKGMELLKKYKSFVMYAIFGVLTTLINLASYYVLYNVLNWGNMPSTALAWLLAVIFAFATNKKWVFGKYCCMSLPAFLHAELPLEYLIWQ